MKLLEIIEKRVGDVRERHPKAKSKYLLDTAIDLLKANKKIHATTSSLVLAVAYLVYAIEKAKKPTSVPQSLTPIATPAKGYFENDINKKSVLSIIEEHLTVDEKRLIEINYSIENSLSELNKLELEKSALREQFELKSKLINTLNS